MKIIILFILVLSSGFVNAQKKGDNTIIVQNVTFDSAVNRLLDLGYRIAKIDKELKTVQTEKNNMNMVIFIRMKTNNDLLITSEVHSMNIILPIEYPDIKKRWSKLMDYAGSFTNISYAKL